MGFGENRASARLWQVRQEWLGTLCPSSSSWPPHQKVNIMNIMPFVAVVERKYQVSHEKLMPKMDAERSDRVDLLRVSP
jgi:hypothetical protein